MSTWIDFIENNEIDPENTKFSIYVTPTRAGDIAKRLHNAATPADVEAIVAHLNTTLSKLKKNPECKPDVDKFLNTSETNRTLLVVNLSIHSEHDDPLDAVRTIYRHVVSPQILDLICERAIGAAKEHADRLIRAAKTPLIDANAFRAEQLTFIQKNNLPSFLVCLTDPPPEHEVESLLQARPTFVRQLELIDLERDACIRAVSDYLRAGADIAVWADAGKIFQKNLDDWDADLLTRYEHINAEIQDVNANLEANARGRIVYRRCAQLQPPLDGQIVPIHFVHGSYNALAHSMRLGWHPDFKTFLGVAP